MDEALHLAVVRAIQIRCKQVRSAAPITKANLPSIDVNLDLSFYLSLSPDAPYDTGTFDCHLSSFAPLPSIVMLM